MDINPNTFTTAIMLSMQHWALYLVLILSIGILDGNSRLSEIENKYITKMLIKRYSDQEKYTLAW